MNDAGRALVEQIHRQVAEQAPGPSAARPTTISCTELPAAQPGDVLSQEWDAYRREVGRLLAEGREHQFALSRALMSSACMTPGTPPGMRVCGFT